MTSTFTLKGSVDGVPMQFTELTIEFTAMGQQGGVLHWRARAETVAFNQETFRKAIFSSPVKVIIDQYSGLASVETSVWLSGRAQLEIVGIGELAVDPVAQLASMVYERQQQKSCHILCDYPVSGRHTLLCRT